jgi:tetratricopeptide (TPR) repeat protein
MRRVVLALSLLLALAFADAAAADPPDARALYEHGTTLYDLGQYREAAHEYEAAFKLHQSPPLLFNIAQAYRLGGDPANALRAYRSYLRRSPDATNRAEVTQYIATCEKQLAAAPKVSEPPPPAEPTTTAATTTTAKPATIPTLEVQATPQPELPSPALELSTSPPTHAERTPVYKRWWLWTTVAVVAAGGAAVALGLTYGARKDVSIPSNSHSVKFP